MRIPDVGGLKDAHASLNASRVAALAIFSNETNVPEKSTDAHGQPKSFGRASAVLSAANGTSGSPHSQKDVQPQAEGLSERQSSCPSGSAFYKCQNGFTGCCSVNPCNPGSTFPDGQKASDEASKTAGESAGGEDATTAVSTEGTKQTESATRTRTKNNNTAIAGIRTASPTGRLASTTTRRLPRPTASAAPNCPRANGRTYTDGFKIAYRIRCKSDNTFDSLDTIAVGTGGYDQCFSSCSQEEKCAGFTYVGLDSGNCYLKNQMPNTTYEAKAGNNYISSVKLDRNTNVDPDASAEDASKHSTGAIVGGVMGGVAFLGLLLLCIALFAKRRRKKIEDRHRATVTHVFDGPIEKDMSQRQPQYQQGYQPGHQRQGSTSHDVFTPYGGNVYDPRTHTRQRSIYGAQTWV